jgi:predicted flap endonuclease-1-like 5' DNA nuclease
MLYLTQTLFAPWLIAALALGVIVGWKSARKKPQVLGLGWLGAGLGVFVVALFVAATLAVPGRLGLWFDTALHFLVWYIVGCCLGTLLVLVGMKDDTVEPVAAWVRPVPQEGPVAEPAPWTMPGWVRVAGPGGAGSVPALQAARDWMAVLRSGPAGPTPVAAWARPVAPTEPAGSPSAAAPDSAGASQYEAAPGFIPRWLRMLRGHEPAAPVPVPDWARPLPPGTAAAATAVLDGSAPWQAVRAADGVTLTGEVANEGARTRMLAAARKALQPVAVADKLTIGSGSAALEAMATAACGHLARLDRGIASVVAGRYTLTGLARTAGDREALQVAAGDLPAGFTLARIDIAPPVAGEDVHDGERPAGLAAPRDGRKDDLKRIRGIGPQNESRLHGLGIWHFDQIAGWTADNVLWVGSYLAFPGRIEREDWVGQAKLLAAGSETEFSKRVAKGLVATSPGDGVPGAASVDPVKPMRATSGTPPQGSGKRKG